MPHEHCIMSMIVMQQRDARMETRWCLMDDICNVRIDGKENSCKFWWHNQECSWLSIERTAVVKGDSPQYTGLIDWISQLLNNCVWCTRRMQESHCYDVTELTKSNPLWINSLRNWCHWARHDMGVQNSIWQFGLPSSNFALIVQLKVYSICL